MFWFSFLMSVVLQAITGMIIYSNVSCPVAECCFIPWDYVGLFYFIGNFIMHVCFLVNMCVVLASRAWIMLKNEYCES